MTRDTAKGSKRTFCRFCTEEVRYQKVGGDWVPFERTGQEHVCHRKEEYERARRELRA